MNKKFSTLMMGGMLLAVPSLVSAQTFMLNDKTLTEVAFTAKANESNSHSDVLVIRDTDGNKKISQGDLIFIAQKDQLGNITYKSLTIPANGKVSLTNEAEALWSFEEQDKSDPASSSSAWYYGLKNNNTGAYLTIDGSGSTNEIVKTVSGSFTSMTQDEAKKKSSYFTATSGNLATTRIADATSVLYAFIKDGTAANALIINGSNTEATIGNNASYNCGIILATAETRTVGTDVVDELNDIKGGKGFEFEVITDEDESVIDNIFDGLELRAFRVDVTPTTAMTGKDSIGWPAKAATVANYYEIPAGVYLATEWSQLDDATLANNTITTKEEFQKATFIAVSPTNYTQLTNTNRGAGKGFTLTTVKGSDMNFYAAQTSKEQNVYDANQESKADEIYVGNACFTITVAKPLSNNDQYQLEVKDARLDKAGKGTQENINTTLYISKVPNTNNVDDVANSYVYLLTNTSDPATLQAVPSTTIADVTTLLNKEATPAIYAIKFLSGEDAEEGEASEYGQYLTSVSASGTTFNTKLAIMPSVNDGANENDPLYQFVVTAVADENGDDEYETVTLTNRQTKQSVTVVLYAEEELGENVYTIYPEINLTATQKANAKWQVAYTVDGKLQLKDKSYKGMIVELIKKENVDKFATFETAKSEEGLYTFEFAKTVESGDRLYAAATRNTTTGAINYTSNIVTSETADQFELIRVKDADNKDKVSYILNDFIYIANDRVVASQIEKDTVAFYSYNVRYFAPDQDNEYYLAGYKLAKDQTNADELVIKYNVDGSVSMFDVKGTNGFLTTASTATPNAQAYYSQVHNQLQDDELVEANNINKQAWEDGRYYDLVTVNNYAVKTFLVPETVYGTLNPVPQTTEFENEFGYINMNADKAAILKPAESMTFRLDTVDTDVNIPSFYISKDNNFLYFAQDSAESYRLTNWEKYSFYNGSGNTANDKSTKLIFKAGELVDDSQALQTMVDGKSVKIGEKADRVNGVLDGLNYFKFQVLESGDGDDTYVIRNKETRSYIININGNLTLGSSLAGATRFVVNPQEATANEDVISASSVKVIAGAGQITIAGAAGKKVVVSNILGQVVANTVITSDNATIAAPQGIVVVAVEGEEAVKAIVK